MTRVVINLPEKFTFSTDIRVRMSDVNMGGHVGSDAFHSIFNEAQLRFLTAKGFKNLTFNGNAMINVDFAVIYKSESFYGDMLHIEVAAAEFHGKGCDIVYRITNKTTGKETAIAKTGMLFFDYAEKKVVEMTDDVKRLLSA